jgi:hypothetical protein
MNDISIDAFRLQVAVWQKKTFEERMRIGCHWDDFGLTAAREVVARNSSDPAAVFIALHGDSLAVGDLQRIASAIRLWAARQPETAVVQAV